jgi:hypothetical protein
MLPKHINMPILHIMNPLNFGCASSSTNTCMDKKNGVVKQHFV